MDGFQCKDRLCYVEPRLLKIQGVLGHQQSLQESKASCCGGSWEHARLSDMGKIALMLGCVNIVVLPLAVSIREVCTQAPLINFWYTAKHGWMESVEMEGCHSILPPSKAHLGAQSHYSLQNIEKRLDRLHALIRSNVGRSVPWELTMTSPPGRYSMTKYR